MQTRIWAALVTVALIATGIATGNFAQSKKANEPSKPGATAPSPVKALSPRDVYYPGTEDLAPNEMRVVA